MLRRALIIDEMAASRLVLKAKLNAACYDVRCAADLPAALTLARQSLPDFVLISAALLYRSGLSACETLRSLAGAAGLPVLALLRDGEARLRLNALLAGASDVLPFESEGALLLAQIRSLLRRHSGHPDTTSAEARMPGFYEPAASVTAHIGLLAPHPGLAARWRSLLQPLMGEAELQVLSPSQLLQMDGPAPDAILLSGEPEDHGSGLILLADLQARQSSTPLAWVAPRSGGHSPAAALDLGADCVLPCDFSPAEAATRLRRMILRRRQASEQTALLRNGLKLALTDPLTGLSNRRHALPTLTRMLSQARLRGQSCAVMLLDLDHFKTVNDTWGHPAGDAVLTEVARRLRAGCDSADLIARYGGEEFLLASPIASADAALRCAENLRRSLSLNPISLGAKAARIQVTASIGLVLSPAAPCNPDELLHRADQALLQAKRHGRDQIRLAGPLTAGASLAGF